MSQFFISCKESKIENNRSFYGCFNIGPFEPSQSITIANALRRTLLSELYGLSIVSIEIEGVTHEYSNLPGVKDSILDILLNIKDIVLKKTINTIGIKPQVGYLKIRGPGVVRAAHLKLPPFIQSVDPDQYIATLTHDGFLNMKFIIQYSNKWLSNQDFQSNNLESQTKDYLNKDEIKSQINLSDCTSEFYLHLKKRRLILKKLKQIGLKNSNLYINVFSKFIYKQSKKITMNFLYSKSYFLDKKINKPNFNSPWTSYLQVPALKLLKIRNNDNSYLEKAQSFEIQKKRKISQAITILIKKHSNKYLAINLQNNKNLNSSNKLNSNISYTHISRRDEDKKNFNFLGKSISEKKSLRLAATSSPTAMKGELKEKNILNKVNNFTSSNLKLINKFSNFFNSTPLTIDSIFNPVTKVNYIIEVNDFKISQAQFSKSNETLELLDLLNISKLETKLVDFSTCSIKNNAAAGIPKGFMQAATSNSLNTELDYKNSNSIIYSKNASNITKNSIFLENILEIKNDINFLKKETPKHNIIFEVWTNGSIHPRDAIYQGFKNLVRIFTKLNKINAFMVNPLTLNSLENNFLNTKEINSTACMVGSDHAAAIKKKFFLKKIKQNEISSTITDPLMLATETSNLITLNDISFLSTYMEPKLKNFYFNTDSNKWARTLSNNKDKSVTSSEKKENIAAASLKIMQAASSNFSLLSNENIQSQSLKTLNINLQQDIGILNLSLRSFSILKRLNINTVKQLKEFLISNNKSLGLNKLSKICLEEIEQSLQKLG